MGRGVVTTIVTLTCLVLSGCASGAVSANVTNPRSVPSTTVPATSTTTTEQPGWTPVSTVGTAIAVDSRSVTEPTGHVVTIFRFRAGHTQFGLHVGGADPPRGSATVGANDGSSIGPTEAPTLLAAFNGGFKAGAGAGGFELSGQILVPLLAGYGSLVIDADGQAHVGIWGQGLPAAGEQVASVRQNLPPLVTGGRPAQNIADIAAWGSTLGGGATVARSVARRRWCRESALRSQYERSTGGSGRCIDQRWRGDRNGAGHQSRMGATRNGDDAGGRAVTGHPWPIPSWGPVPGRVVTGLRHRAGRRLSD